MNLWTPHLAMPLLGKELAEQAARRRTYALRVVYASLLFAAYALVFHSITRYSVKGAYGWQQVLGSGRDLLESLIVFQSFGIVLFLPAMMSGTIAAEKEQASLGLLFLTDMGPWELLLQKYLGRLIPMFSFLLLSLPLMAISYSLGGIEARYLCSGILTLLLTCLQVGAFALMCSALCSSAVGALLSSYIGLAMFYALPPLSFILLTELGMSMGGGDAFILRHIPLISFMEVGNLTVSEVAWRAVPVAASALLFLAIARAFLVRRAFTPARNPLLRVFLRLDRMFTEWNAKAGGITIWDDGQSLPDEEPVAWRELHKRAMGRLHHLCRIGLAVEIPVLFLGLVAVFARSPLSGQRSEGESALVLGIWLLAALTIGVQGANSIVAERTHRTLDVLLATPLSGADIVRQKMRALKRLCVVFAIPLATLLALSLWLNAGLCDIGYVLGTVLAICLYLPLLAWLGLWIGLKIRTRLQAVMTVLAVLVGWCAVPWVVVMLLAVVCGMRLGDWAMGSLMLLSPAFGILFSELGGWRDLFAGAQVVAIILNALLYGAILYGVRRACLKHADRYLRREGVRASCR